MERMQVGCEMAALLVGARGLVTEHMLCPCELLFLQAPGVPVGFECSL